MLVLTRKPGEGIKIGDDITVKIIETKGGAVRLGIEAPRNQKIYRQEVYNKISTENMEAAQWSLTDLDVLSETLQKK
ncbi:MAG: carbon storage regulator [Desulfobacterales bacterium]|nr:MAG: carbon storage regulator [Desulfobacterales bacterium]